MSETSGRSTGKRRRLAVGILILAFIAQLLDAVNAVITLVTGFR
jgi:hypothetical protein